jgi:hypothetical protein
MQPLPLAMEPGKSLLVGGQTQSQAMFWFLTNFLHRVRHNISTQTLFFSLINENKQLQATYDIHFHTT